MIETEDPIAFSIKIVISVIATSIVYSIISHRIFGFGRWYYRSCGDGYWVVFLGQLVILFMFVMLFVREYS